MTQTALAARRARPGTWTPAKLGGLVGWWHADDLALTNGAAVTAWADRKGGLTPTQATGSQQPTYVTNSLNGHAGVSFARASNQYLSVNSVGSVPTVGPVTVWVIAQQASAVASTTYAMFEVSSATSTGYIASQKADGAVGLRMCLTTPGIQDYQSGVYAMGLNSPSWLAWTLKANNNVFHHKNFLPVLTSARTINGIGGGANAGASRVTIGAGLRFGSSAWDGIIYDVIVSNADVSAADHWRMAKWVMATYGLLTGTPYNAASNATTPSGDATGTLVEHSIADSGSGGTAYNGQRYINAFVPLGSASTTNENPSINFSNDGNTWNQTGVTNPVVPYPGGGVNGNNSDPGLLDNRARDGKLYIYYRRENASTVANNGIWYVTSSNGGTTWTAPTQMISGGTSNPYLEPKVVYDATSGNYWLWYVDIPGGTIPTNGIRLLTSSTPTGFSGTGVACSFQIPGSRTPFHFGTPQRIAGKWVSGVSDNDGNDGSSHYSRNLWIASTTDGSTWNVAAHPILLPGATGTWDTGTCYRGEFIDAGDGVNMNFWYTAGPTTLSPMQMSQIVTVPQSEIP